MRIVDVDWSSLSSVIKYAKTQKGARLVVIKQHNRDNYNIVHYANKHFWHSDRATPYYITGKARGK